MLLYMRSSARVGKNRALVGWANRVHRPRDTPEGSTRFAHAVSAKTGPAWARRAGFVARSDIGEARRCHPTKSLDDRATAATIHPTSVE
jgi:hypothetical protein